LKYCKSGLLLLFTSCVALNVVNVGLIVFPLAKVSMTTIHTTGVP